MCGNRLMYLLFVLLLPGWVNSASAIDWTNGDGANDSWCTPGNWDPAGPPGPSDTAVISTPERGPVIDCDVDVGNIDGPMSGVGSNQVMDVTGGTVFIAGEWDWSSGTGTATINISGYPYITVNSGWWRAPDHGTGIINISDYPSIIVNGRIKGGDVTGSMYINMSGGFIQCPFLQYGAEGGGELNMSGGFIYITDDFDLGGLRGSEPITVNMSGGSITVDDAFMAPANADRDGVVTINLYGGTIECGSFTHAGVSYSMDITEGTLKIAGDVRGEINADVSAGYITAYGGAGTVSAVLDSGYTVVTGLLPDPNQASNPDPADEGTIFGTEVTLSWTPGISAVWHDVYLGTEYNDVNDAVDPNVLPGRGRWDSNHFDACDLMPGQTYYWRIDEVNDVPPCKGKVWSFMMVDGFINSIGMGLVRMHPGTFEMGSWDGEWDERPVHKVTISREFYMGMTEVTAEQYRLFDANYSGTEYATGISWYDANGFCAWLSQQDGVTYRLPTEAEWEYVCRAGTTTPYSSGGSPPAPETPSPWGLMNMHNSPREWVWDRHGEYPYEDQVAPVGPEEGMARVVRGGGLDTSDAYYFRSSNRAGIGPGFGGGQHDIGFRVVLGDMPSTAPKAYQAPFARQGIKENAVVVLQGPDPNEPYFNQRPMLPIPPENQSRDVIDAAGFHPAFRGHNHSPGMEVCPNGDVLMIIYTSYSEYEPGVSLMASRLRFGSERWDMPSYMFDFPGVNDHAPMLWNDNGTLHFFWGCPRLDGAGPYPFQWMSSTDNGVTWDEVKFPVFVSSIGSHSRQPINTALRDVNDTIYVSSDGSGGQSVLWKSEDNGLTWYDPGGRTGGRHTSFVMLSGWRILGMGGKNTNIGGHMPRSISIDGGESWDVNSTPFNWLGGNQRPCVVRLSSGRLFFCSDFQKSFDCDQAPDITELGSLAALSDDEGETWLIKKIPTALEHECYCWPCHSGTLGYSAARQAANGVIHVITTMNRPCQHFEMNEAWILDAGAGGDLPPDPGETGTVNPYQENYPGGGTKATWSAKTCDDGRYLLHGTETWYYESGRKQYEATYYNGRKVGAETYWGPDSLKQWSWGHNEPNDSSVWTQWWPNGLKHVESRWHYGGMVAHGDTYFWDWCGAPEAAWNFNDGDLAGSVPLPAPQARDADLTDDDFVDNFDLRVFVDNWLLSGPAGYNTADLNCDGEVELDDFAILALQWLQGSS